MSDRDYVWTVRSGTARGQGKYLSESNALAGLGWWTEDQSKCLRLRFVDQARHYVNRIGPGKCRVVKLWLMAHERSDLRSQHE